MSLFDKFKRLFKTNRVSIAPPSHATLSRDIIPVAFAPKTYPRSRHEQIPLLVTSTHCEYYLKEVMKLRHVLELGEGSFGIVFNFALPSAMYKAQPEPKPSVVVKTFRFGSKFDARYELMDDLFRTEVRCYQRAKHANIVQFHSYFNLHWNKHKREYFLEMNDLLEPLDLFDRPGSHYLMGGIVLEKVQCTLTAFLDNQTMDERLIGEVFRQIGGALVYLHRKHFTVHQDLKGSNIGIAHISSDGIPHLKLLDLGNCAMDKVEWFNEAEQHSTRAFIESTPAAIDDPSMKHLNDNCFLQESRQLAQMIIRLSTDKKILDQFLNAAFEARPMNDYMLKSILLRMATKFVAQSVSLSQVWHYLGFA